MATKFLRRLRPTEAWNRNCPLSPLLYSLYNNDIHRFLTVQRGAATALDSVQIPHCDYADDIALTSNTAECLQFQLNKFHNYTRFKGLKLNTDKTKIVVFFSKDTSAIPTFTYDGTPLELVTEFKYLEITLTRDGSMLTAAEKMADNFRSAIARVYRIGDSKGIKQAQKTCHAMAFPGLCFDSWSLRLSSMGHFFSDIWFLKNNPHICLSSWLPEKTPGCQEKFWYSLRVPRNRSDAYFSIGSDASYNSGTV